ncbi:MAG TPA: mannose-6-phosphate isomerase, class I [Kineosporiaceae bacterium]|nr:mannose-6-phosphate isomerase, class I [Kineosporiaceae bacterium]
MTTTSGCLPALGPWPARMANPIRDYDWGSTTHLARMQGRIPDGRPEAELWMGAHPSAPSALIGLDGSRLPLDELLRHHSQVLLGAEVMSRHGTRLPYLLKVLAIARPLSLQVHPDPGRARRRYTEQQADGRRSAAHDGAGQTPGPAGEGTAGTGRPPPTYSDPYAKPEMLYALRRVDAMCGFRSAAEAAELVRLVGGPQLAPVLEALTSQAHPHHQLEDAFAALVTWPAKERQHLVEDLLHRTRALLAGDGDEPLPSPGERRTLTWIARLAALHPGDPLVGAPLLLEVHQLEPGETLFIPAGAPHAYLAGLGVEIMANSDNVLRAGLTHKEIAVDELLQVIDGNSRPVRNVPELRLGPHEVAWRTGVAEFQLTRLRLDDSTPVAAYPAFHGPQVVLCTSGTVGVATSSYALALHAGESAFVGASGGPITLAGPGEVFRAAVGEPVR